MKNNLDSFLNLHEFGGYNLIAKNDNTSLYKSSKISSPSQEYFFRIFEYKCCSPKDQKIILDTFYQIRRRKCQYLLSYSRLSFTFQENLTPAFSMKNIATHTLEQILSTNIFISWKINDVMNCLFAIAEGMSYLHSHLICHGNLCPSNIVTDMIGQFYLCDFGLYPIKKLYYREKDIFNKLYKDPYMENNEPTFKNDVYSYGVLMSQIILLYLQLKNDRKQESLESFLNNPNRNKFNSFPKIFAELIPACLNSFACERPSFRRIIEYFQTTEYEIFDVNVKNLFNEFIQSNYLLNLASNGDHFALNKVGEMYESGKGFEKNLEKAAEYYKKAADLNNSEAQNHYGILLQKQGEHDSELLMKGAQYLQQSAEQGNIHGMANYGVSLLNGHGVEKNIRKAEEYLKKSADLGYSFAQAHYGYVLLDNNPTLAGINNGLSYIKKAMSQRNIESFYTYGLILQEGKFVEKNEKLAIEYYKMAADMGSVEGMMKYAECNMKGIGIEINEENGLKYYQLAAYHGNEEAKEIIFNYISNNANFNKQTTKNKKKNEDIKPKITSEPQEQKPQILKQEEKQQQQQSSLGSQNNSQEIPASISTSAKISANNSQELPTNISPSCSQDSSSLKNDKEGNHELPLQISSKFKLISLGEVVYDRPNYHTDRYIFPVGYQIEKEFFSVEDPNKRTFYRASVLDGGESPIFRVESIDDKNVSFQGQTPTTPWNDLKKSIEETKKRLGLQVKDSSISGPKFFGFSIPIIADLIDKLPNAELCTNHVPKNSALPKTDDENDDDDDDDGKEDSKEKTTPSRVRKPRKQTKVTPLNNEQQNQNSTQAANEQELANTIQININRQQQKTVKIQKEPSITNTIQININHSKLAKSEPQTPIQSPINTNIQQQQQQQQQPPNILPNPSQFNAGQQAPNAMQTTNNQQNQIPQNTPQLNNVQQQQIGQNAFQFNTGQQIPNKAQISNNQQQQQQQQQQQVTQNAFQFNTGQPQANAQQIKKEQVQPRSKEEEAFNNIIKQADYYLGKKNISGAIKCYEEAARRGYVNMYIKLYALSSSFDDKIKYLELAIQHKVPGSIETLRSLLYDRSNKTKDSETFEKLARIFEKYEDLPFAAFAYANANDKINYKICYEEVKKNLDSIEDKNQMFFFGQLLRREKEFDLALMMFNRAKEKGLSSAEDEIKKLTQNPPTPPPQQQQEITNEIQANLNQAMNIFGVDRNKAYQVFSFINQLNCAKASFIIGDFLRSRNENEQNYMNF